MARDGFFASGLGDFILESFGWGEGYMEDSMSSIYLPFIQALIISYFLFLFLDHSFFKDR